MEENKIVANNGSSIVLYNAMTTPGLKVRIGKSQWFANEQADSFKSSIGLIYQTSGGEDIIGLGKCSHIAVSRGEGLFFQ